MSITTTLHVVPVTAPAWIPNRQFIEDTLHLLGVTAVSGMVGFSIPAYWDSADGIDDHEVFAEWVMNASVKDALDLWEQHQALVTQAIVSYDNWTLAITDSTGNLSADMGLLDSVGLTIGPFSIPSPGYEYTIGRFRFEVTFHGYGLPIEWDEYLDRIRNDREVTRLLSSLRDRSGHSWAVFMSGSY